MIDSLVLEVNQKEFLVNFENPNIINKQQDQQV